MFTTKQNSEIAACVAGFLKEHGYENAFKAYIAEAKMENENLDYSKLNKDLEMKFFMVSRMQIKIAALEKQLAELNKGYGTNPLQVNAVVDTNGYCVPRLPELHTFTGHRGAVNCVLFHPVYTFFATASDDSTIKIWDIGKQRCERTLSGHTDAVNDLAISPDGRLLASCSNDMFVKIWDMTETFECVKTFAGHEHSISSVAFVRNNTVLTASRDHFIKLWDLNSITCLQVFHDDTWVRTIRIHANGKYFASSGSQICVWDVENGDRVVELQEHTNVVEVIAWAPENVATELKLGDSTFDDSGLSPNVYIEGKPLVLASGSRDSTIRIWHVNIRTCLFIVDDHTNWIHGLAWHPNGKTLMSVGDDKTLRSWNVGAKFASLKTYSPHQNFIRCLALDNTGKYAATGSTDHTIKLFECR
uniref:LisH domain-containing protein n=1 Tax=Panagrolaimus sp. JU765 TaxID=591449 RepID=A0AC34RJ65_9BILA